MDRTYQQNQSYNILPPGYQPNNIGHNNSNGNLWGSTTRSVVGIIQILYGIIEIAVITTFTVLVVKSGFYISALDIVGIVWGIISAVVLIITGGFGRCSKRKSCKVIAYMVLGVSSALCGAFCLVFGGRTSWYVILQAEHDEWPWNRRVTCIAASCALLATFLIHVMMTIVGASFTCGAVCDCNTHDLNRRRYAYNYEYSSGTEPRNNLPTSPLLQPNAPPVNSVSQPPSYGTL